MKKTFNLKFMALSVLLMLGHVCVFAQTTDPQLNQAVGTTLTGNVVTYRVNDATPITVDKEQTYSVSITGLDADGLKALGTDITLNVPVTFREKLGEKYYRFYVTKINEGSLGNSFYGYTDIKELNFVPAPGETDEAKAVVPFSVASNKYTVGDKAFYGCSNMTKLTFTSNCKSIGEYAFQNTAITSFEIPAGCGTISKYAFYNCKSLLTVTVASGNEVLTTLGDYVFGNSGVNNINLTNATKLASLTGKPFIYALDPAKTNDVLKEITLPASLTTIDATVFQNCTFLQKINGLQATGVTVIGDRAFLNCRNLQQLDLPNANLNNTPFVGCAKLATLTFPDGYNKTIGLSLAANSNLYGVTDPANANYSEADQKALKTITFNTSSSTLGFFGTIAAKAFKGSLALNKVEFKTTLRGGATIGESAFEDVTTLQTLTFSGINTLHHTDDDGYMFDGAITIGQKAFKNTGIDKVEFIGISTIGYDSDKKMLTSTAKAVTIDENAFSNCANLASVKFGGLTVQNAGSILIKANAFSENAKLASVDFGNVRFQPNNNKKPADGTDFGTISIVENAFVKNPLLATVTFGTTDFKSAKLQGTDYYGNGTFEIKNGAFTENVALAKVQFGNISSDEKVNGTFTIGEDWSGKVEVKEFNAAKVFGDGKALAEVIFGNVKVATFAIDRLAFASTSLKKVEFGNVESVKTLASSFEVKDYAFLGGSKEDKTVAIKDIKNNDDNATGKLTAKIGQSAFAADLLKSVTIGNVAADVTVNNSAFQSLNLQTVSIASIKASKHNDATVDIKQDAFQSCNETDNKVVTIGEIADNVAKKLTLTIGQDAFAGDKLQKVEIAKDKAIAAYSVNIGKGAFQGKSLEVVTLGDITATKTNATVTIGQDAFQGGEVANKTVKIGNIVDKVVGGTTYTVTATINANAFAAKKLATVDLGQLDATFVAVKDYAFANTNTEDVMTETITIGKLGAGVDLRGASANYVFNGPQADGTTYNVTIKGISATPQIPLNTFVAPAKGKASYTFDCDIPAGMAIANIPAGAYQGSKENVIGTPKKNATTVTITGDYNGAIGNVGAFTNVDVLTIAPAVENNGTVTYKKANTVSLAMFSGARVVTLGEIPAGKLVLGQQAAQCGDIESITFEGSVEGAIGTGYPFASTKIRKIEFKNVKEAGVKVAAGAIAAGAFEAAANAAAAAGQNITVIYQEGQTHDEAVNIFDRNAFVATAFDYAGATVDEKAAADANIVTLYTTTWCKANVFEAADNDQADATSGVQKKYVWRLGYSESDVAPGQDIVAKVAKPAGYTYAYGKLYIPKGVGMKYRIKSEYDAATDKNQVQVYYGQIDNSNSKIYMYQLPIINDYFWIDATDVDQAFMIRTSKAVDKIEAVAVEDGDEEEAKAIEENDNFYYFDAALAKQNQLRYNPAKIVNQELRSNAEFKDRAVYMMDNPETYGYQFRKIDKTSQVNGVPRYMPAKSLYVVAKNGSDVISAAPQLEVIFVDDENVDANTTGIETVKNEVELNSDAIYNLQGVRVSGAQKGIFIKNGKKFVVK